MWIGGQACRKFWIGGQACRKFWNGGEAFLGRICIGGRACQRAQFASLGSDVYNAILISFALCFALFFFVGGRVPPLRLKEASEMLAVSFGVAEKPAWEARALADEPANARNSLA